MNTVQDVNDAMEWLTIPVKRQMELRYFDFQGKEKVLEADAPRGTFLGKTVSDMENYRQQALEKIEATEELTDKLAILMEAERKIKEFISYIRYNDIHRHSCRVLFVIEMCSNMLLSGASITEVHKAVPGTMMGDIYNFAVQYLGINVELTAEEQKAVDEYNATEEKTSFCMSDIAKIHLKYWDIPKYDSDKECWTVRGDETRYSTLSMANKISGGILTYPYYLSGVKPYYANSWEELVRIVMKNFEKIHFEGLEGFYGCQEMNYIMRLKDALIGMLESEE